MVGRRHPALRGGGDKSFTLRVHLADGRPEVATGALFAERQRIEANNLFKHLLVYRLKPRRFEPLDARGLIA